MEQELIKAFGESTRNVIQSMSAITPQLFKPDSRDSLKCFVTGTLGLTGDISASVSLSFSKEAIESIYQHVFREEGGEISFSSIGDLVGEITGMVLGNARKALSVKGITVDGSLPTVVLGDRQHLHNPSGTTTKIIPFLFNGHSLFVELNVMR